jgi:PTS system galactitol-specific IIA component
MTLPMFSEDLILLPEPEVVPASEQVIQLLCDRLAEKGYVDETFCPAVLEREARFPTGLPTSPFPAAIPHSGALGVKTTGVGIAVLKRPGAFRSMESPERFLDVRIVWLLAIADAARQVPMLQWIISSLQDRSLMEGLVAARDSQEAMALIRPVIAAHNAS